ncbi:MAG: TolC family protein [Nitrospirales bacterium]|nr:TolC family protein [Nitrospirales bacterium]
MRAWWIIAFCAVSTVCSMMPREAQAAESVRSYDLLRVLELALERNPLMEGAQSVIDQSVGRRIAAGAYPNPTITSGTGYGMLRDAGVTAINTIDVAARERLTEYNASVGQPLEWPSKRQARQQAAEAGLAGATVGLVETRLNLAAEVKIEFYELLLAQRNFELAKQNLDIVEDVRRIVNTRVRLGEAPQFELIKAEVEVLKAQQVVTRIANRVRVHRVVLDTLTAGALGSDYAIEGDFQIFWKDLTFEPLVGRALEQHPTLQRLVTSIEQADRNIEFERQARVPNVTVNAGYWREIGREAFTAGVSVPTPIWYRQQGQIAGALGVKRGEEAQLLRQRNVLIQEVNQHFKDAQTTAHLIDVFQKGLLKQAQEALRIAQFSFRQGAASLLEVLDAQRVQQQILFDYTQARFELSVALTRLERAVGGPL